MQKQNYFDARGNTGTWEFVLLEYRFRPILVWRVRSTGVRTDKEEEIFRASTIDKVDSTRWCGESAGVALSGSARYDSGEAHPLRLFYDFETARLLSTLDAKTKAEDVENAFQHCHVD